MLTPLNETYALCGAIAGLSLALLHALVWRVQRLRWSVMFSVSFALMGLLYAFDAQLQPAANMPNRWAALLATAVVCLATLGMVDYTALRDRAAAAVRGLALAGGAMLVVLTMTSQVNRLVGFTILSTYLVAQATMAFAAMWRDPRQGYGLVFAALLSFPVALVAVRMGFFDVSVLRYVAIVPMSMMGVTVLTTGLLRAQQEAREELVRRQCAEEALQRLNDALEQRVADRTHELREMVGALESFNRTVSHDLRGPLGGIAGVSRMASEAVARGDTATAQRLLGSITRQAESSVDLVGSLLALAKVGESDMTPRRLVLDDFVRDTIDALQASEPSMAGVRIAVGPLPEVEADPGLLRQVFVNLVGNAAKFAGGVADPRIELGAFPEAGGHVLFVRDNGVGFASEAATGLFEPFQRLHAGQFQGHGVGLSIVKRIVERHGGRIWATAAPNAGATFYFSLGPAGRAAP